MTKKNAKPALAQANPKLAREWHPMKNAPLTPNDVSLGAHIKVWWRCDTGHEWDAYISDRSRDEGCPYCSGRRANKDNCLKAVYPRLAREWHPAKNAPLTPKDVTAGSGRKVWWVCGKGHEWTAPVYRRTSGNGCPFCSGRQATAQNCLQAVNPKLAREWHPTKNAPLTPKNVLPKSNRKVWWVCRKGHEWQAILENRSKGDGCPFCSGRYPTKEYCLQAVNPKLAREWHPTKNAPLTPRDMTPFSAKKAWWLCSKGHEWESDVKNRSIGTGCPYCAGRAVGKDNCLQAVKPALAREWHPTKNKPVTPRDITCGSEKKVWWLCGKGHEWKSRLADRSGGDGCPYCSGRFPTAESNLRTANPKLAKEWHAKRNEPLTSDAVLPCSGKRVWWVCKKGHEWAAVISYRNGGDGCPICSGRRPEKNNSLDSVAPWIAKEWHPTKNSWWSSKDVAPYSRRLVWWKCKKGHESRESVCSRSQRGGCPVCVLKRKAPRLGLEGP